VASVTDKQALVAQARVASAPDKRVLVARALAAWAPDKRVLVARALAAWAPDKRVLGRGALDRRALVEIPQAMGKPIVGRMLLLNPCLLGTLQPSKETTQLL
jgi:hypothetical protein